MSEETKKALQIAYDALPCPPDGNFIESIKALAKAFSITFEELIERSNELLPVKTEWDIEFIDGKIKLVC